MGETQDPEIPGCVCTALPPVQGLIIGTYGTPNFGKGECANPTCAPLALGFRVSLGLHVQDFPPRL